MDSVVVKFAETKDELEQTFKLRYEELVKDYDQSKTQKSDHQEYDKYAHQLIAVCGGEVIACYRLVDSINLGENKFVCEDEYTIDKLKSKYKRILELSRAVVKKEYRNGKVLLRLWKSVFEYCLENDIDLVIGDASFYGTDRSLYIKELSLLASEYPLDESLDVKSKDGLPDLELVTLSEEEKEEVRQNLPPLIKAYIMFGAKFAKDAFVDYEFKSVDVFVCVPFKEADTTLINRFMNR